MIAQPQTIIQNLLSPSCRKVETGRLSEAEPDSKETAPESRLNAVVIKPFLPGLGCDLRIQEIIDRTDFYLSYD